MAFRLLADDGSIHVFPDGTTTDVMAGALSRYNAQAAPQVPAVQLAANTTPQQPGGPTASAAPAIAVKPSDFGPTTGQAPPHNGVCLPNVNDFLKAHLAQARTLAASMPPGVAPQEILAVSGNESGYGDTKKSLAAYGNYFGLHNRAAPYPGQIGTHTSARPPHSPTPQFSATTGYMDSGHGFADVETPYLSPLALSSPDNFFTTLHQHGYARTPEGDKDYVSDMRNVYGLFGNCMRQGWGQ